MTPPRRSLAPMLASMEGSAIREIAAKARALPYAIHLEFGEPDQPTPEHVVAAAARAAGEGWTRYTPTAGIPELREALSHKLERVNGLQIPPDQVVVTAGAVQGLHATLAALVGPGDEVLIPDPGWPNFAMLATLVGASPVRYPLRRDRDFQVQIEDLERLITTRTRILLINSPSNPLGSVMDADRLGAVIDFAEKHDLWVISDEAYDELVFDGPGVSTATVGGADRVISVFSFSKTYAMTGWRIGYVAASSEVAQAVAKVQQAAVSCMSAPTQFAALAALEGPQDIVTTMRRDYRERRDKAMAQMAEGPLSAVVPAGGFYLWVDVSAGGQSGQAIAHRLLDEYHVAVVPGTGFGAVGGSAVRLSLAAKQDDVRTGLDRLRRVVEVSARDRDVGSEQR